MSLRDRVRRARCKGPASVVERARGALLAWLDSAPDAGPVPMADGTAAVGLGRVAVQGMQPPPGLACAEGCAFCCILTGADGGTISEAEARALHAALLPLAGQPDGRDWHPKACPALDPATQTCRAYDARPMICRSYVSTDVSACRSVAGGVAADGPGTLGGYHVYLAALGLSRAALKGAKRVSTFSLARLAAASVAGQEIEAALSAARHKPALLDAELKRSAQDHART